MPQILKQQLNPYDLAQEDMTRVQVWVDPADRLFLHSIYPVKGLETYMLCSFYKTVVAEIKAAGITHFTIENANHAYNIIARHLATPQPVGEVSGEHDAARTSRPRKRPAPSPHKPTDNDKGVKGRP